MQLFLFFYSFEICLSAVTVTSHPSTQGINSVTSIDWSLLMTLVIWNRTQINRNQEVLGGVTADLGMVTADLRMAGFFPGVQGAAF